MSLLQPLSSTHLSIFDRRKQAVELLVSFHAATWQQDYDDDVQGCYWHYDTRPNAWRMLSNQGLEGRRKRFAKPLDDWLKDETPLRSWIHGDAKEDNFHWEKKCGQVAMCDFQYVGRGCPCKDLAFYLTDICDGQEDGIHDQLVDVYFDALLSKLPSLDYTVPPGDRTPITAPTRQMFDLSLELAYCDYLRFLFAWRGQHNQLKERIIPRVQRTMNKIDGGSDFVSEGDYREALRKFMVTTNQQSEQLSQPFT